MPGKLINGEAIAKKLLNQVAGRVAKLKAKSLQPSLGVVLVGTNPASVTYVNKKREAALKAGINFTLYQLPASITTKALINKIYAIQTNPTLCGLIVQLPLPEPLYTPQVLNAINPQIDVDCLTDVNLGKLIFGKYLLAPPTPSAVFTVLKSLKIKLAGKNVTVVGQGALVGKPLATMLTSAGCSVTTINSRTKNVKQKCLTADILISAVGKKDLIMGNMVKPGAVVIDCGFVKEGKKLFGDVNTKQVLARASYLTPTPGGIGPITVAQLLYNTVLCAEDKLLSF